MFHFIDVYEYLRELTSRPMMATKTIRIFFSIVDSISWSIQHLSHYSKHSNVIAWRCELINACFHLWTTRRKVLRHFFQSIKCLMLAAITQTRVFDRRTTIDLRYESERRKFFLFSIIVESVITIQFNIDVLNIDKWNVFFIIVFVLTSFCTGM